MWEIHWRYYNRDLLHNWAKSQVQNLLYNLSLVHWVPPIHFILAAPRRLTSPRPRLTKRSTHTCYVFCHVTMRHPHTCHKFVLTNIIVKCTIHVRNTPSPHACPPTRAIWSSPDPHHTYAIQLIATANTSLALACQMQITPPPKMRVVAAPLNSPYDMW